MSETEYNAWWPLHIRAAKGETLTEAEQAVYEVGLRQMHTEETLKVNREELRQARARTIALKAGLNRVQQQYQAMEAEIAQWSQSQ